MKLVTNVLAIGIMAAVAAFGQTAGYPYFLKSFAGTFPLGDGGPATSALLYYPNAAVADGTGNTYILDSSNYRIRRVASDGKISTIALLGRYAYDMKMGPDGSLYVSGEAGVFKISPKSMTGAVVAGTGSFGYSGDGGPANAAQVGNAHGVAVDTAGNVYFTDGSEAGHRVRQVTTDGKIRTIAGMAGFGYNGDNRPAATALLYEPIGIAVDSSGYVYVADAGNRRVRKFTAGGDIATIAGTGVRGQPTNGAATLALLAYPYGLCLDSLDNLYVTDYSSAAVLKVTPDGNLRRVAGNFSAYGAADNRTATDASLQYPTNVSVDKSGNALITDETHRVRQVAADGSIRTVAGRIHYSGDGEPATGALLNEPQDIAVDNQGNVFIADNANYRIRKVNRDGIISTIAGDGIPGIPVNNNPARAERIPMVYAMAIDSENGLYLATQYQVFKIAADGRISVVAGTGASGDSGDSGPATQARFLAVTGIAVDSSRNVYVADFYANRVRMINAETGRISAFAGTGVHSRLGDGGPATSATLSLDYPAPLAADRKGNVYIGDGGNLSIRMVSAAGTITTVAGNGTFGRPDGVVATSTGFSSAAGLAVDTADNLYITSNNYGDIYRLSGNTIRRITGNSDFPAIDGVAALSTYFFSRGIKADSSGDLYAVDNFYNLVRKLILNSPTKLSAADGDNQSGQAGQSLPKGLKVTLGGRAGYGVSGVTVNFAVTSGSGTLSAASTQTDASGTAGVGLTLGAAAGSVVVTATAVGSGLPPVQFTESAVPAGCVASRPLVSSVNSAGDFGAPAGFAAGSWLEVKGTNLAPATRQWTGDDFQGANAPTALDGISVAINGKKGFAFYISSGQINVQAPADAATGPVQLTVSNCAGTSAAVTVQKSASAPGLLAPAAFKVGGKQYLVATLPDGSYVGKANLIPGVAFRPAAPGDIITAYGIGFGEVTPAIDPGVVVSGINSIPNMAIAFGETPATISFAGLAPGAIGLYQFNFAVPGVPDGDYLITFTVDGQKVAQALYLTVAR